MDFKNLSKKRKIYLAVVLTLTGVLVWAFITAGIITRNFNREQLVGTEKPSTAGYFKHNLNRNKR